MGKSCGGVILALCRCCNDYFTGSLLTVYCTILVLSPSARTIQDAIAPFPANRCVWATRTTWAIRKSHRSAAIASRIRSMDPRIWSKCRPRRTAFRTLLKPAQICSKRPRIWSKQPDFYRTDFKFSRAKPEIIETASMVVNPSIHVAGFTSPNVNPPNPTPCRTHLPHGAHYNHDTTQAHL